MTRIIGISGKKQSGKSTSANWIHGLVLKGQGLVEDFNVDANGKLAIETFNQTGEKGWGVFDVDRKDEAFVEAFADAGFEEISVVAHEADPWQTVNGIEFRSMTAIAYKADANGNTCSGPTLDDTKDACCSTDSCC